MGEFEQMYRDFQDPWHQSVLETFAAEKALALNAIQALKPNTVLEIGCGLGFFTKRIREAGVPQVIGMDVSETALQKARQSAPECTFVAGDILDLAIYDRFRPDLLVMAETTWYVLGKLEGFKQYLRQSCPQTYLVHLLTTYPRDQQQYGRDFFTDLDGILRFFDMNYIEHGVVEKKTHGSLFRTYFVGRYASLDPVPL